MVETTELYQHVDGGVYSFMCIVKDANTGEQMAVYCHLWPFDRHGYTRPLAEFNLRFRRIQRWELLKDGPIRKFRDMDRKDAQFIVTMNKRRRKAAEASILGHNDF